MKAAVRGVAQERRTGFDSFEQRLRSGSCVLTQLRHSNEAIAWNFISLGSVRNELKHSNYLVQKKKRNSLISNFKFQWFDY